ncbi:MAG: PD40 domain-containing protein [Holophagaceae bacterium]|nr:PD40 domain-containing protein [Holophagaceae bacterium]
MRSRSKSRMHVAVAAFLAMLPVAGRSQGRPSNDKQMKAVKVHLPLTRGATDDAKVALQFWQILSKDLSLAGPFETVSSEVDNPGTLEPDLVLRTKVQRTPLKPFTIQVQVLEGRTHRLLYRKVYEGSPVWIRRIAHRVADDFTERATGVRGLAESRIVFARETSKGVKEIFQVDRDGEGLLQLTHYNSLTLSPSMASDGRLAYVTYKGGPPEIWGQRKVGGPHVRLYPLEPNRSEILLSPAWSPDGQQIAFAQSDKRGNCDVMVLDLKDQHVRRLTSRGGNNTEPAWDATGTRLAFTSDRSGTPQIYLMESDGSNPRRVDTEGRRSWNPALSPDGNCVAYSARIDGKNEVLVHDFRNSSNTQITHGEGSSEAPAWSPDGHWITYTHSISGTAHLMVNGFLGHMVQPLGALAQVQSPDWTRAR